MSKSPYKYPGNSPGKEAGRTNAYARLSKHDFYTKQHIVIAGDCGDIHYLIRQGVTPSNIWAFDIDPKCTEQAYHLGVSVAEDDLSLGIVGGVKYVCDMGYDIASINVDLCMSMINGLPILKQVYDLIGVSNTHLFFTFLCGHDAGLRKQTWEHNPGEKRLAYFKEKMGRGLYDYYTYQSWSKTTTGSPMCMGYL